MSSISSSSSSDEDESFLTHHDASVDREALVRRKLMENFYGATPAAAVSEDSDEDDEEEERRVSSTSDYDSSNFDSTLFTQQHVRHSNLHTLLETTESLSLEIRTLDSTMQTMVYENYTRFIDATDAIQSIPVQVEAHQDGLTRLTHNRLTQLHQQLDFVEPPLVVEKRRIQRLLTRLDALLKLPQTLRHKLEQREYWKATVEYQQAAPILQEHLGYESLKSIDDECALILQEMRDVVQQKLHLWSSTQVVTSLSELWQVAGTLRLLEAMEVDEIENLAIAASGRALDRFLDEHSLQVAERQVDLDAASGVGETAGSWLIPRSYSEAILELATLYITHFANGSGLSSHMRAFVSDAFETFLSHVKALFLDDLLSSFDSEEENQRASDVSSAMLVLVQVVRELASGLSLPEIGVEPEAASGLVEQASELTQSIVRLRVDQKFKALRESVLRESLIPFLERAKGAMDGSRESLSDVVDMANSALSDCLQLADDTIREVFTSYGADDSGEPSPDLLVIREGVQSSTKRFALWLASTIEAMALGTTADADMMLDDDAQSDEESATEGAENIEDGETGASSSDPVETSPKLDSALVKAFDSAVWAFLDQHDDTTSVALLAVAEMCRLAQRSVAENLEQSIAAHSGVGKKKSRSLFPSDAKAQRVEDDISASFHVVASRVLVLFAATRGSTAGAVLCSDMVSFAKLEGFDGSVAPTSACMELLAMVKTTLLDCAVLLKGTLPASPVPEMNVDTMPSFGSHLSTRKTGLQLDVERMFKEQVSILPPLSETVDFTCSVVAFLLLKVAFRSLIEMARMLIFTRDGYRQALACVELLKLLIPHYVDSEMSMQGGNACDGLKSMLSELIATIGDRCMDAECGGDEAIASESKAAVASLLKDVQGTEHGSTFLFTDEPGSEKK